MLLNRDSTILVFLLAVCSASYVEAAALRDIPGEGDLRCLRPECPDSRGMVSSTPPGLVTGSLSGDMPTFDVRLNSDVLFLTFSGGDTFLGPLGLNPAYNPQSIRDSRIPVSGQRITLDITNETAALIAALAFYLEIPQTPITGPFPVQADGISFGVWCDAGLAEPRNCPENIELLAMPTGPGTLNPADITPSAGPDSTFGDLLRFANVNLPPGETARYNFFITDRKGTLDPSTGGSPEGASRSFNLEIVASPIPEPLTSVLIAAGLFAFFASSRRRSSRR